MATQALYTNNAETTLASEALIGDTSLTVLDGSRFPSPSGGNYAYLTIASGTAIEIVKLTARSSNTLTVVRGQEGTSAQAFPAGADVDLRVTAAGLTEIHDRINFRGAMFYLNAATLSHPEGAIYFTFDTEAYDTDAFGAAGGTTITIPSSLDGRKVRLTARMQWTAGENPLTTTSFEKNGSGLFPGTAIHISRPTDVGDQPIALIQSANIVIATGDVFKVLLNQSNTGADTINLRGEGRSWFQIEVVD